MSGPFVTAATQQANAEAAIWLDAYPPILLDRPFPYTATRDDGECGCAECHKPVGFDLHSKFAAIADLLEAEEFAREAA